jgi:hypothetical protein
VNLHLVWNLSLICICQLVHVWSFVSIDLLLFPLTGKFQVVIQKLWPESRVALWRNKPHASRALAPFWKQLKRHWGFCPLVKKLTNFKLGPWKNKPSPAGLAKHTTEPNGLSAYGRSDLAVRQTCSTWTCEVILPSSAGPPGWVVFGRGRGAQQCECQPRSLLFWFSCFTLFTQEDSLLSV